jgi:hypothetical protein
MRTIGSGGTTPITTTEESTIGARSPSEDVAAMRKEPSWTFRTLEASHWPMVSAPDELVALLAEVASEHG